MDMSTFGSGGRSRPKTFPEHKSPHLLFADIPDKIRVARAREPGEVCAQEPRQQAGRGNAVRPTPKPLKAFYEHEKWVISRQITGPPILEPVPPRAVGVSGRPMVNQLNFRKSVGPPPEHVGPKLIHRVPARSPYEASDCIPAGSPVNFGSAANMERRIAFGFLPQNALDHNADRAPPNSKFRVRIEPFQAFLKIGGSKRDITIQIGQKMPSLFVDQS